MIARILADLVALIHFLFVLFVPLGGLLVLRWPRLAWVHVPAAVWGVLIEFAGWFCPLTPLENALRRVAGQEGYGGGFIENYLLAVVYPQGLTRTHQIVLGTGALLLNVGIYTYVWSRRRRS